MLVVTFKLATHTKFWSLLLIICVIVLSIALYVSYMWISNFYFSEHILGTTYIAWTSGEVYFVVLFCTCFILFVDGIVIFIDFKRGGYISKMRDVIDAEKEEVKAYYEEISLRMT